MKKGYIQTAMALLVALVLLGLLLLHTRPATEPVAAVTTGAEQEPEPEIITEVTLAAVGDIMIHMPQLQAAYDPEAKKYDFTPCFFPVRPLLAGADLAVANLETTLAGPDLGFSGYPRFNSPAELAAALKWAGFDLVSTANNHALDRGEKGVLRTLENLAASGLLTVGTYRSWEEREETTIVEVAGQRLAFIAYTYGTNGILPPQGKEYLVKVIDREEMARDVARAREQQADWIIVFLHFGNEYQPTPSAQQRELVAYLIDLGADIILGSHPHVLQPVELVPGPDTQRVIAYSLGNFVSNQRQRYRDSGMILLLTLEKNITCCERSLKRVEYIPTWVHRYRAEGKLHYRILPVEAALGDYLGGKNPNLTEADHRRLQEVWEETTSCVEGPGGGVQVRRLR